MYVRVDENLNLIGSQKFIMPLISCQAYLVSITKVGSGKVGQITQENKN